MEIEPLEEDEQATLVDWVELRGWKFTAIPNSNYTTSIKQKTKNYRQGLRGGLPDLLIILPEKKGLVFLEMKRRKTGKISPKQKEWIDALNEVDGVCATVCRGAEEGIEFLENLIQNHEQTKKNV